MRDNRATASVNLLPPSVQERLSKTRIVHRWTKIIAAIGIITVISICLGRILVNQKDQQIAVIESSVSEPNRLLSENLDIRSRIRAKKSAIASSAKLRNQYSPIVLLSLLSDIRNDANGEIEVEKIDFKESFELPQENKNERHGSVVLMFKTTSVSNSAKVVAMLESSNRFASVRLASPLEKAGGSVERLKFSVECLF